jgi:4-amino-4-deoxy-L-arabinose transferase-like glycosyltransferase
MTPTLRRLLAWGSIALAAAVPRLPDLGGFLTVDEANFWLMRSARFLAALERGDFAATALSTHPGVTTMWAGALGIRLGEWLATAGLVGLDYPTFLALARLPAVLLHIGCILVGYGVLRRLWGGGGAWLAAALWALDPFIIGYSRLLHVDALAGSFMTVALLAGLLAGRAAQPARWLVLGGVAGGLAVLSKSPALVLVPLALVLGGWQVVGARRAPAAVVRGLMLWGSIVALTIVLLWPALWVDPLAALRWIGSGVADEGAQPHMLGNFFRGQQDDAPGWLFYPVALAARSTPLTLLGVLLLPWVWRHVAPDHRGDLARLALFIVVFAVALSLFPKKFNRYLEPAMPAMVIVAAAAYPAAARGRHAPAALAGLGLLAALNAAAWHPYPIAAFNQLLGGAALGARTFSIGWGEGLEQVAAALATRDDIRGVVTVTRFASSLAPFMPAGAAVAQPVGDAWPKHAGYAVVYVSQTQRGLPSPPLDALVRDGVPWKTIVIHGVPYAWIYQLPPPVALPRAARFGEVVQLIGADAERVVDGAWMMQLVWQVRQPPPADLMLFAHLVGSDGVRVSQADIPLATAGWTPGTVVRTEIAVPLPAALPAGSYRLYLGVYRRGDGQRLAVTSAIPPEPERSGAAALPLHDLVWP